MDRGKMDKGENIQILGKKFVDFMKKECAGMEMVDIIYASMSSIVFLSNAILKLRGGEHEKEELHKAMHGILRDCTEIYNEEPL